MADSSRCEVLMTPASFIDEWQRAREGGIKRHLTLTDDGLLLGAGTVIAKRQDDGGMACAIDGREDEILALVGVAYDTAISPSLISHLRRADRAYLRGDPVAAQINLAFTGLNKIEDAEPASFRLFLADRLLRAGLSPQNLPSALSDDTDLSEWFEKASADDPKHPGWPAGTEGGLGGKFRPRDGTEAVISEETKQRILRQAARTAIRQRVGALLRITGEALLNAVPGADVAGDAAIFAELLRIAAIDHQLTIDTKAVIDFFQSQPHTLEELSAAADGPRQPGYEDHHIVAQGGENAKTFPEELLQNPNNIVRVPTLVHQEINAAYFRLSEKASKMTVYQSLQTQPFDVQYEEGVKIMRDLGIIK
jgi:hypothetical protein